MSFELAVEFNRIFSGNEIAHGEFVIQGNKGLKKTGKARTIKEPVTLELWEKHLQGEQGLGIVPIMQTSQCIWGCVDIDQYEGLDLEQLSFQLPEPLVMCRTKSGGLHVFIFMQSPTTASLMRKKLTLVARSLGQPNAEIFPKQDILNDGEIGNWLNMPYFNHETTTRYCIKGGIALTATEFIEYVGEMSINTQQLVAFNPEPIFEATGDPEFADAPPCLQHLIQNGFPTGSRNNALFSMGVFARKKFAAGWEDKVFDYNQRFMGPGSYSEVAGIIRSLSRKGYQYKCKDQPLMSCCDKEACSASTYGVMPSNSEEKNKRPNVLDDVTQVICYAPTIDSKDEPYWVFTMVEFNLEVTVDMARSQAKFAREYLRQCHRVILPIKDSKWVTTMNELLGSAEIHELAPDAGPEGQMWIHLEDFCTNKARAKVKDELIIGKPWVDNGRVYFRSGDFTRYLDQQRFRAFKEKDIWTILKRRGAQHHHFIIKGKHIAAWSVDMFDEQIEEFDREPLTDENEY